MRQDVQNLSRRLYGVWLGHGKDSAFSSPLIKARRYLQSRMILRLQKSIETLYAVFGKYHGNPKMAGSSAYGNLDQWNRDLFYKSLHQLDEDDLSGFTGKAITTWGEVEDYKHFLPRIFELTAIYKTPYEIWIAFDKLEYGNWSNWDPQEQEAIYEYMIALFENLLNDESDAAGRNFEDYFTSIFSFYPDFQSLLKLWDTVDTKASFMHLSAFIIEQANSIFEKGKVSGFLDSDKNLTELKEWLLRKELKKKIEQAYFKYEQEEFADNLSWAEQILDNQLKL